MNYQMNFDGPDLGGSMVGRKGGWNPFLVSYGNTVYSLDDIVFYDENGPVYRTNRGWFCNLHYSNNPYRHVSFDQKIKRKQKEDFTGKEVYIVSKGKDPYFKELKAILYIPIDYLQQLGYTIEDYSFDHDDGCARTERLALHNQYFDIMIKYETHYDLDKIKEMVIRKVNAAQTREELKDVLKNLYI